VRIYFDTSVLVSALVQGERQHAECLHEFTTIYQRVTSAHSIAELFATLTSGRLPVQFTPGQAIESIRANIFGAFEIVPLTSADYMDAAVASSKVGARGGAFYDVLHLQAAKISKCDQILTLNLRHFLAFAADDARHRVRPPNAVPSQ
jgi:predicted nucleic acid-binding protein